MLILHAGAIDHNLYLWGERPIDQAAPLSTMPYDAGVDALTNALCEILGAKQKVEGEPLTIWLPSTSGMPLASSALIAEPPLDGAEIVLAAWTITAIRVSRRQAIDLLTGVLDGSPLAPGVFAGKSLIYWSASLRFAGSLVARQNYLPSIEKSGEEYYARWKPVLTGDDREAANGLAASMPQVCRALTSPTPSSPTNRSLTRNL